MNNTTSHELILGRTFFYFPLLYLHPIYGTPWGPLHEFFTDYASAAGFDGVIYQFIASACGEDAACPHIYGSLLDENLVFTISEMASQKQTYPHTYRVSPNMYYPAMAMFEPASLSSSETISFWTIMPFTEWYMLPIVALLFIRFLLLDLGVQGWIDNMRRRRTHVIPSHQTIEEPVNEEAIDSEHKIRQLDIVKRLLGVNGHLVRSEDVIFAEEVNVIGTYSHAVCTLCIIDQYVLVQKVGEKRFDLCDITASVMMVHTCGDCAQVAIVSERMKIRFCMEASEAVALKDRFTRRVENINDANEDDVERETDMDQGKPSNIPQTHAQSDGIESSGTHAESSKTHRRVHFNEPELKLMEALMRKREKERRTKEAEAQVAASSAVVTSSKWIIKPGEVAHATLSLLDSVTLSLAVLFLIICFNALFVGGRTSPLLVSPRTMEGVGPLFQTGPLRLAARGSDYSEDEILLMSAPEYFKSCNNSIDCFHEVANDSARNTVVLGYTTDYFEFAIGENGKALKQILASSDHPTRVPWVNDMIRQQSGFGYPISKKISKKAHEKFSFHVLISNDQEKIARSILRWLPDSWYVTIMRATTLPLPERDDLKSQSLYSLSIPFIALLCGLSVCLLVFFSELLSKAIRNEVIRRRHLNVPQ